MRMHGRLPRLTTYRSPPSFRYCRYDRGEDVDDPNAQKGGGDPFGGGNGEVGGGGAGGTDCTLGDADEDHDCFLDLVDGALAAAEGSGFSIAIIAGGPVVATMVTARGPAIGFAAGHSCRSASLALLTASWWSATRRPVRPSISARMRSRCFMR